MARRPFLLEATGASSPSLRSVSRIFSPASPCSVLAKQWRNVEDRSPDTSRRRARPNHRGPVHPGGMLRAMLVVMATRHVLLAGLVHLANDGRTICGRPLSDPSLGRFVHLRPSRICGRYAEIHLLVRQDNWQGFRTRP